MNPHQTCEFLSCSMLSEDCHGEKIWFSGVFLITLGMSPFPLLQNIHYLPASLGSKWGNILRNPVKTMRFKLTYIERTKELLFTCKEHRGIIY